MVLSNSKPSDMQLQLTTVQWVHAYWVSRCIYVVAKLGIADLLKDGSLHCDALAAATNTHSDSLYRVLRALASVGIFAETQPRCFELTPMADCLQSNVPGSIQTMAIIRGEEHYYQSWGNLMYCVQTGKSAFEHLYDMDLFQHKAQDPVEEEIFSQDMTSSKNANSIYQDAYDFSSIDKLVDVGGGTGTVLTTILERNLTMKGVLFDLPKVIDKVKDSQDTASVNSRCQLVGGNFFEVVPEGGDAYLLSHVLLNWDDDRALTILQHCHQAMGEQGRLLVIDYVLPASANEFCGGDKFIDVYMLVICSGGRLRTEAEFRELFKSAGFKLTKIVPTQSQNSIIEAVKVDD